MKFPEAVASAILNKVKDHPQEAWDAIYSLVKENNDLRVKLAQVRISLDIMKTVMTIKGLDVECMAEYEKLTKTIEEIKEKK